MIDTIYFEHAGISLVFESYMKENLFKDLAVCIKYFEVQSIDDYDPEGLDQLTMELVGVVYEDSSIPRLNSDYNDGDNVITIDLNAQLIAYTNDDGALISLPIPSFIEAFLPGA